MNFIEEEAQNYLNIKEEDLQNNLKYYIRIFDKDHKITPSWQWGVYEDSWEIAKKEWTGILTLEALMKLRKFDCM